MLATNVSSPTRPTNMRKVNNNLLASPNNGVKSSEEPTVLNAEIHSNNKDISGKSGSNKVMLAKSKANRDARIVEADSLDGILKGVEGKNFVKAGWCGCRECEDKVKEFASATARVMIDQEGVPEKCAICGKPAKHKVIFARAY